VKPASQLEAARRAAPRQITVALLAGTPEGGRTPLRLDREIREIDNKVRLGQYRDQIQFQQTMATQVGDIIDALNRFDPDVCALLRARRRRESVAVGDARSPREA
jgi:hypothetical protein